MQLAFDSTARAAMPAVTIKPMLEYERFAQCAWGLHHSKLQG
jgi:hypothetical protein